MSVPQHRATTATSVGGALVALSGLLLLVALSTDGGRSLFALAALALAAGTVVLVRGGRDGDGVVGGSRAGRAALLVFGLGPLLFLLTPALLLLPLPSPLVGMTILALVTVATVGTAISVVRARVLHGVARWALAVVAADAVLTAAMSTVRLDALASLYLGWDLPLVRPAAVLIWGLAVVHSAHAARIRRRTSGLLAAWRRTTDVGGTSSATEEEAERA